MHVDPHWGRSGTPNVPIPPSIPTENSTPMNNVVLTPPSSTSPASWLRRLGARVRRPRWSPGRRLDEAVAVGRAPAESAALEARVLELSSATVRWRLAQELEKTVARAERRYPWWEMPIPRRARALLDAKADLRSLAATLTDPAATGVQGVALASCLVRRLRGPIARDIGD